MPANEKKNFKVYISVDMEGITGLVNWEETDPKSTSYERFRRMMTAEADAAVQGSFEAGAETVIVRDAHENADNLIPEKLDERALLIKGWSGGPLMMMEGIDESFDACAFVGYHARAGSRDAVLGHTWASQVFSVKLNNRLIPELGLNAAIAGHFGVPVVFVSGDRVLIDQARDLLGPREYLAVKEGIGSAARSIHPKLARKSIREGVKKALSHRDHYKPFLLEAPYTIEIRFNEVKAAWRAALVPGSQLVEERTVGFSSPDFMDIMKFFCLAAG